MEGVQVGIAKGEAVATRAYEAGWKIFGKAFQTGPFERQAAVLIIDEGMDPK